jgi:hypothetical protein
MPPHRGDTIYVGSLFTGFVVKLFFSIKVETAHQNCYRVFSEKIVLKTIV